MFENQSKSLLSEFSRRALQRLQDKKRTKTCTLFIPSLQDNITIRSLSSKEINEIVSMDDEEGENRSDKYTIYLSVVQPSLKDAAKELIDAGEIQDPVSIVDMFELHEINEITTEIMKLSGVIGKEKVTPVVDDLKN